VEVSQIPRIIYDGDIEAASHLAREGMQQLNILKSLMSFNKLQQDVRRVEYIDGSRIVCRSCFGEDVVHIYVREREKVFRVGKPVILVAVGYYEVEYPPHPGINPYITYWTHPCKVMLYDVEKNEVIETNMTTTELNERHGINVWHPDEITGILTDKGLRLSDDMTHEKSFPLERYLIHGIGLVDAPTIYTRGAKHYPAVAWTADVLSEPPVPNYPDVPSPCSGYCWWNGVTYSDININTTVVDTKESYMEEILNSRSQRVLKRQYDLLMCNARKILGIGACPPGTTSSFTTIDPGPGRFSWLCEISQIGPAERILRNYPRFGGSHRLTTRDTYPSLLTGSVGYIQSILKDYQYNARHRLGGGTWGGGIGCPLPCPSDMYTYERTLTAIVKCSFGELYETQFSYGTYNNWDCIEAGTQGCGGEDFEFPGRQQAFIGIEAGIVDNKVISVVNIVAGTERIALPWIGTYSMPGKWNDVAWYTQPKVQVVKAGLNVTELNKELPYVERILSANDIDYFSLPTGGNFEIAVQRLVDKYYKLVAPETFDESIDSTICIESRIIVKHIEKDESGIETGITYRSCSSPNPWITPKIGETFWRSL
jgi:hypothetical protein